MEEAHKQGYIKALGISNFNARAFKDFVKEVEILPCLNQCQTHLFYQQKPLRIAMSEVSSKIILQSWSPFISGCKEVFENALVQKLSKKYAKTPAQIILRFLNEENIALIPKTSHKERMKENLNIFDFTLETEDKQALSKLDTNKSYFSWVD